MTANMRELLRLRDEFRKRFPDVDGLISVGFARSPNGLCLSVVVESDSPEPGPPDRFRGMRVRVDRGSRPVLALGSSAQFGPS
jgi:hypothetical protein